MKCFEAILLNFFSAVAHGSVLLCENIVVYQTVLKYAQIPQLKDLDGAASGLIRLQEIYKLYPHNITKGEMFAPIWFHFESFTFSFQVPISLML